MSKDPTVLLDHILESVSLIQRRIRNATLSKFINDIDLQDLVVHRFEIIGEAVRKLNKNFREEYPNIDWQAPAKMRSALIHGYDNIDLDIVWDTAQNNLPSFKKQIRNLLKQINSET